MNRRQKIIVSVTGIFIVLLALLGLTFAYFLTQIRGNDKTSSISVTTANLLLEYGDGNEIITMSNLMPGKDIPTKTFTVTNRGNGTVENYKVYLENVINQLERKIDLTYTLTCKSYKTTNTRVDFSTLTEDGECIGTDETTFPSALTNITTNTIGVGYTHYYELKLVYEDTGTDQSVDMGKIVQAKVNIYDEKTILKYGTHLLLNDISANDNGVLSLSSDKITDFSNVNVTAYNAENIFDIETALKDSPISNDKALTKNSDGTYTLTMYSLMQNKAGAKYINIPSGTTVHFSLNVIENNVTAGIGYDYCNTYLYNSDFTKVKQIPINLGKRTGLLSESATLDFDAAIMSIGLTSNVEGDNIIIDNIQVSLGSKPSSYSEYSKQTVKANADGTITGLNINGPSYIVTNSKDVLLNYKSRFQEAKGIENKSLNGKTIVNFGDSIFGNYSAPTDISSYVAEQTGATVYNVGFGGARMSTHPTAAYDAFSMDSLADAVVAKDYSVQEAAIAGGTLSSYYTNKFNTLKSIDFEDVDIITIAYGANDFNGIYLDNDSNKLDREKFAGALRYSIETIQEAYPNIEIVLWTPIYRYWVDDNGNFVEDTETKVVWTGLSLIDYVNSVKSVGAEYNLFVIDAYNESGINTNTRTKYFNTDPAHPNNAGIQALAKLMSDKLLSEYGS